MHSEELQSNIERSETVLELRRFLARSMMAVSAVAAVSAASAVLMARAARVQVAQARAALARGVLAT
jgi:hypothetical protein